MYDCPVFQCLGPFLLCLLAHKHNAKDLIMKESQNNAAEVFPKRDFFVAKTASA